MGNEEKILAMLEAQGAMFETLVSGQQQINQCLDQMGSDVAALKTDFTELKTDFTELKADFTELKADVIKLKAGLSTANKKLETIAAMTHEHEHKFQKIKAI